MKSIESYVKQMRLHYIASLIVKLHNLLQSSYGLLDLIETLRLIKEPFLSNDILCRCFIVDYLHNKDIACTCQTYSPKSGFFIVMNEGGQVLALQFTSSTSIDEVTDLLKNLQSRLKNTWATPGKVFVDNCCQLG